MTIYSIIQELRATRSHKTKTEILTKNKDNELMRRYFKLCLHPRIKFFYKKKLYRSWGTSPDGLTLSDAFDVLESKIANRQVTGNAAGSVIQDLFDRLSYEDGSLLQDVLNKDSDCGVNTKAEELWPGTMPRPKILLASPFSQKLFDKHFANDKKMIIQTKMDGSRNLTEIENGDVVMFTRSGDLLPTLAESFSFLAKTFDNFYIDGELIAMNKETGKFHDRKTSNGIIGKIAKGTISKEELDSLYYVCWDCVHIDQYKNGRSDVPYEERLNVLQILISICGSDRIRMNETKFVSSYEEAQEYYKQMRLRGEEGAMLKRADMPWEDARSELQLKMKAEIEADVRVIGYNKGKGVLENNLGSLICQTEDKLCECSVSGFPLTLRSEIYANLIDAPVQYNMVVDGQSFTFTARPGDTDIRIGSIIEVTCNGVVTAKKNAIASLYLPRFSRARPDKTVANNMADITDV